MPENPSLEIRTVSGALDSNNDESQVNLNPEKPKAYYIVLGTFIFGTMIVGSIIFLAFLSIRKI